ncbi:hypothetical protein J4455_01990 [Candidatus Woesearchaeota archaeon]|nr:hypothetical protein [Candidatus Woesearchaeota archaeon]
MIKNATIDIKTIRKKLDRDLVALIQFPDEQETLQALKILEENKSFVVSYNDDCYGLADINNLKLLHEEGLKYRIVDINKKYRSFPSTI